MQMAAIVKRDLRITFASLMDFTGDVILGVPCCHQHARQHHNDVGAAVDAAINPFLNDRFGKLQKTALHNPCGVSMRKQLNQLMKFLCALYIPATMARDQDRWFHKCSFLCGAVLSVLRSGDSSE